MATEITVPRLGMAVADANIIEWKVKEGEKVTENQVAVVIETEKLSYEVEAPAAGFIHIVLNEDDTAPVGGVIGIIAETKKELEALQKEVPKEAPTTPTVAEASTAAAAQAAAVPAKEPTLVARGKQRIKISPVARKKAEEHALDIARITGTGPEGRIVRKDIEKAIANKEAAPAAASVPTETIGEKRVKQTIPLKGMRGAIAEHMHRSLSVSAQLTAMGEIDMTHMVRLRKDLVDQESVLGTRITYTDLFVFAISRVLRDHPRINSSITGNEIKVWEDINIGVAVALDEGLIVPVVKAADQKSFK